MLGTNLIVGTATIVICVIFHVAALAYSTPLLRYVGQHSKRFGERISVILVIITAVIVVIGLHTIELWSWAILYLYLGEFENLETAVYFSAVTATTLGYGDLTLSTQWQLLSPFEAMGGLILFGASTAYLLQVMHNLFAVFSVSDPKK